MTPRRVRNGTQLREVVIKSNFSDVSQETNINSFGEVDFVNVSEAKVDSVKLWKFSKPFHSFKTRRK